MYEVGEPPPPPPPAVPIWQPFGKALRVGYEPALSSQISESNPFPDRNEPDCNSLVVDAKAMKSPPPLWTK